MSDPAARPPIRFGTDGVRGPYGAWPLTEAGVERMGRGIAAWLGEPGKRVVVGRDTRESGPALEDALVRGLVAGAWSRCAPAWCRRPPCPARWSTWGLRPA